MDRIDTGFLPRANLEKLYANEKIRSESHQEIEKFSKEFALEKCYAEDCLKHLELLNFRKEKRKEKKYNQISQNKILNAVI